MSKKTQHPLPTIGSQNWGSTLNSYLRNQDYANQEIQQEIEDIYAQQSNVAQTVLSSGVLSDTVDSKCPGLYSKSGQFVTDGELLTFSSTSKYYYKGYAVVFGNSIISELIGGDNGLEIVAPTSTTLSTIDARCVYAYYNISSKAWVLKFGETNDPSTESSISLDPYYICLGVLIKIGSNYYWHYKTMKANLSISSKKWMLDEPHATLNTYMTYNSTDKKIGVYFSETLDGTLSIQALGINPFTSTETATNDLTSDLKTFTLAQKGTTASYSYYILRVDGAPTGSDYIMTSDGVVSNDGTSVYRLCATSVTIDGKALLLWQKATSSLDIDRSIFNNTDFSRLWYYCDPVELYRVKGSTMKATAGSGLSPINANGIDPHVTTLIKHTDGVWFGEGDNQKFHFNIQSLEYPSNYNIFIPPTSDKTNYTSGTILTNTMTPFDGNIAISTKNATSNRGIVLQAGANSSLFSSINKKYQLLLKSHEDTTHYSYIDLADSGAMGHQIEMVVEDGDKHPSILLRGDGYLKLETIDNNKTDTTNSKIELFVASTPHMALTSPELLVNHSGSSTNFIKINPKDSKCTFTKDGDTSVKKTVTFDLSGDSPEIVVGGDATLSSDGLYLPSGNSGIKIDTIQGSAVNVSAAHKFHHVGVDHLIAWTNGGATDDASLQSWEVAGKYADVDQCKGAMADLYGRNDKDPWDFNPQGYYHYFWFRDPNQDETTTSADQPPALNEGDSITISYYNSAGTPQYKTYGDWAVVGDKHGRYGYIKEGGVIKWTIILSTTPSVITGTLAPKLNKALHIKNYFFCGLISSTALDLDVNKDVTVAINHHCTHLTHTGKLSKASATISSMTDCSYINIDAVTGDSNVGIRKVNNGSWVSISDSFSGNLYMYGCDASGGITILKNSGAIDIKELSSTSHLIIRNKWHLYNNICYYDDGQINYSSTLATVKSKTIVAQNPNLLWKIQGFSKSQNYITTNEFGNFGAITWSNAYGNEDDQNYRFYTFIPDLGVYKIIMEIYDEKGNSDGKGVDFPAGILQYNPSKTINLLDWTATDTFNFGGTNYQFCKIWEQAQDSDHGGGGTACPGLYYRYYLEGDRICLDCVIQADNVDLPGSGAWGVRVLFGREYDSTVPYYVTPVCRLK